MKLIKDNKKRIRARRHGRIRSRVIGTAERPRLAVFRSNKQILAQLINDELGTTLAASSSQKMTGSKQEKAIEVGKDIATQAKKANIDKVVFDRGGFLFAGNIKVLADSAREAGLAF